MFSIGKTDPRLYKRTLASAGTSCVVVTKTFTQLLLRNTDRPYRVKPGEKLDEWILNNCPLMLNEDFMT